MNADEVVDTTASACGHRRVVSLLLIRLCVSLSRVINLTLVRCFASSFIFSPLSWKHFQSFGLRKVDELVGYGLSGEKAPELSSKTSVHLEADEYHAMLSDTSTADGVETVIVDVRNTYESAIGHFAPPPGGAKLIDPKMRNSHDFPG